MPIILPLGIQCIQVLFFLHTYLKLYGKSLEDRYPKISCINYSIYIFKFLRIIISLINHSFNKQVTIKHLTLKKASKRKVLGHGVMNISKQEIKGPVLMEFRSV